MDGWMVGWFDACVRAMIYRMTMLMMQMAPDA
jgi:hypothetical protein